MLCTSQPIPIVGHALILLSEEPFPLVPISLTFTFSMFFLITVGCCLLAFFIGLLFVQRSGNYFVAMFDDYSATLPLLIVVILENVAVSWVYGTDKYVLVTLFTRHFVYI